MDGLNQISTPTAHFDRYSNYKVGTMQQQMRSLSNSKLTIYQRQLLTRTSSQAPGFLHEHDQKCQRRRYKTGKEYSQKRGQNRSIHYQAWSSFRKRLQDKAPNATAPGPVGARNPKLTSQICSQRKNTARENRKIQAILSRTSCGHDNTQHKTFLTQDVRSQDVDRHHRQNLLHLHNSLMKRQLLKEAVASTIGLKESLRITHGEDVNLSSDLYTRAGPMESIASAKLKYAREASDSGAATVTGIPSSPPSLTLGTNGI